ncbi:hypothetical protein QGP82_22190 [Leptothoe sp. LEGE 181152]|nr:hypothetical protein [Leptothoe sp. LEGE 181152]
MRAFLPAVTIAIATPPRSHLLSHILEGNALGLMNSTNLALAFAGAFCWAAAP